MNLTVGQQVRVFARLRRLPNGSVSTEAEVTAVRRKYAIVQWPEARGGVEFEVATGESRDGYYRVKTLEQADADDRLIAAKTTLNTAGLVLVAPYLLTNPQVEELAAIVKNMLAEKPADYESEVANGPQ